MFSWSPHLESNLVLCLTRAAHRLQCFEGIFWYLCLALSLLLNYVNLVPDHVFHDHIGTSFCFARIEAKIRKLSGELIRRRVLFGH